MSNNQDHSRNLILKMMIHICAWMRMSTVWLQHSWAGHSETPWGCHSKGCWMNYLRSFIYTKFTKPWWFKSTTSLGSTDEPSTSGSHEFNKHEQSMSTYERWPSNSLECFFLLQHKISQENFCNDNRHHGSTNFYTFKGILNVRAHLLTIFSLKNCTFFHLL